MAKMFNRARMSISSTGTGTLTLGGAVLGYQTFATAGVANGDVVSYCIEDGGNFEFGTGTYTSSGTTLTRTVTQSYNGTTYGTSPISVTTNAQVFVTALAADLTSAGNITSGTLGVANGGTGLNTLASGRIPYGAGTSAFGNSANFVFDGTNNYLTVGNSSGAGTSQITAYGASNGQIAVQNSTNWSRLLQNSGDLYIDNGVGGSGGNIIFRQGSGTTERMRITSAGLVGIGTASPGHLLSLAGTGGNTVVNLVETGVRSWGIRAGGTATNTFDIADLSAGATRLTIDASGNLGIGTSSPTTYLGSRLAAYQSFSATTGVQNIASIVAASTGTTDSTFGSRLLLYTQNPNGNFWPAGIAALNDAGGSNLSALGFYTATSGPTLNERMRITSAGNVGIGTTTPAQPLVVSSGGAQGIEISPIATASAPAIICYNRSTSAFIGLSQFASKFDWYIGANPAMTLDASGNVGIGTTSPSYAFDVNASATRLARNTTGFAFSQVTNTGGSFSFGLETSGGGNISGGSSGYAAVLSHSGAYSMQFGTSNTVRMTLDASGNLGIGTTSPGYKLDVQAASAAINIQSTTTTSLSYITLRNAGYNYLGVENSTGGGLFTGTSAYALAIGTVSNYPIQFATGNALKATIDSSGNLLLGGTAARATTVGTAHLDIFNGTAPAGTLTNGISLYSSSGDFNFMDASGNGYKVGFRNIPQVTKSSTYTPTDTSDVGKHISTNSGVTVNASIYSAGDVFTIYNNSSSSITLTAGASVTFRLAGTATTGPRTLAQYGVATLLCVTGGATPTFVVSGGGVT